MNASLLVAQCRIDSDFYENLKVKYAESLEEYVSNSGGGIITSASTNGLNVAVAEGTTLESFCSILAEVITEIETGAKTTKVQVGRFSY